MDYPEVARDMAALIEKQVAPLVGSARAGRVTGENVGGKTAFIDRVAEDAIIAYVRDNDIECQLITEESGIVGEGDLKIILDPLDGTINAVLGIPFYSVSVAFWGERKYGFVKDLCTKDVYEAFENGNPSKNGKEIRPDCTESAACGYIGEGYEKILPLCESWRCFGSLALELSYVAAGNVKALVDLREKARIVDIAGAQIIAEACGVLVTDEKGQSPFSDRFFDAKGKFRGKKIICALPDFHEKILNALND